VPLRATQSSQKYGYQKNIRGSKSAQMVGGTISSTPVSSMAPSQAAPPSPEARSAAIGTH
jgi:hypothetical protein